MGYSFVFVSLLSAGTHHIVKQYRGAVVFFLDRPGAKCLRPHRNFTLLCHHCLGDPGVAGGCRPMQTIKDGNDIF